MNLVKTRFHSPRGSPNRGWSKCELSNDNNVNSTMNIIRTFELCSDYRDFTSFRFIEPGLSDYRTFWMLGPVLTTSTPVFFNRTFHGMVWSRSLEFNSYRWSRKCGQETLSYWSMQVLYKHATCRHDGYTTYLTHFYPFTIKRLDGEKAHQWMKYIEVG